jgi:hypothetical protein
MKTISRAFAMLVALAIAVPFLGSCEKSPNVYLNAMVSKSNVPNGVKVYLKLVQEEGENDDPTLFDGDAAFANGLATVVIEEITPKKYRLYGFIDMNKNAGINEPIPDGGDLVTVTDVVMTEDRVISLPESYWFPF